MKSISSQHACKANHAKSSCQTTPRVFRSFFTFFLLALCSYAPDSTSVHIAERLSSAAQKGQDVRRGFHHSPASLVTENRKDRCKHLLRTLLRLIRLVEEEVRGQLLVLIACEVGLDDEIALEAEAA